MDSDIPVCRLCLSNEEDSFEIFGEKGVTLDVGSILTKHFWFEVNKDDSLPQTICSECWRRVESFHELYLKVERKYKSLYDDLQSVHSTGVLRVNIKEEYESLEHSMPVDDKDALADEEECAKDEIKKTKLEEQGPDSEDNGKENEMDDEDEDQEFVPDAITSVSDSDSEGDLPLKTFMKTKKVKRKTKTKTKLKTTPSKKKTAAVPKDSGDEQQEKKQRFDSNRDNETVKKYFDMICDVCGEHFHNFLHAKKHHRTYHDQVGYLYCCDKKFFKLYRVMQHCMWHENPEAFKCKECSKCFSDGIGLRDHMDNLHAPAEMRIFACDICPKKFLRKHMLTTHKRMTHISNEDKKFACEVCGQRFIVQAFLQAHIKKVHENADSRICDICAKFFKCSKSYEIHYMCVHSDVQHKVQCELCGKWLKHADSLKEHKRRHIATHEKCEFCGRISSNKKALRAHIRSAHSAPSYPCTVCNKLFKKTQTLKEHMAIHAGRTDLYSCSFCTKTFRSSANMYAHRKKAHPKEYEENRSCGSKYTKPTTTVDDKDSAAILSLNFDGRY